MSPPKNRKIAVLGSRSVGKSSLTVQFVEDHFVESYYPTIENTFSKMIKLNGQEYNAEIIDTAGQDEYSMLNSKHSIGIHGYILVYSITSRNSFDMVKIIRDKILNHTGTDWVPISLVGNKCDLKLQRNVSEEEGRGLAHEWHASWTEASARLDENVNKAFEQVLVKVEHQDLIDAASIKKNCLVM